MLVRYRKQLVDQRKQAKLRVRAILRQQRIKAPEAVKHLWTKRGIAWLKSLQGLPLHTQWIFVRHLAEHEHLGRLIAEADERIEGVVNKDTLAQRLMAKKGVGMFTAAVICAEVGTFRRFRSGKRMPD